MSKLTYHEKKKWILARKEDGNQLYRNGKHEEAISKYMEAVMGVAIGDTANEKRDAILTLQVPLLSNLAACMMIRGQYGRSRSLLDEAVDLLENYSCTNGDGTTTTNTNDNNNVNDMIEIIDDDDDTKKESKNDSIMINENNKNSMKQDEKQLTIMDEMQSLKITKGSFLHIQIHNFSKISIHDQF